MATVTTIRKPTSSLLTPRGTMATAISRGQVTSRVCTVVMTGEDTRSFYLAQGRLTMRSLFHTRWPINLSILLKIRPFSETDLFKRHHEHYWKTAITTWRWIWLQSRGFACPMCEEPHRLQLKLHLSLFSSNGHWLSIIRGWLNFK